MQAGNLPSFVFPDQDLRHAELAAGRLSTVSGPLVLDSDEDRRVAVEADAVDAPLELFVDEGCLLVTLEPLDACEYESAGANGCEVFCQQLVQSRGVIVPFSICPEQAELFDFRM